MEKKNFKNIGENILKGLKWFCKSFIWVIPVLIAGDMLTKWWAENILGRSGVFTIIPGFFDLKLLYNKGAAWGSFSDYTVWLAVISMVASVAMIGFMIWKWKKLNWWYRVCLFLMISGALGNFIDRLSCAAFGTEGVVDMLHFTFGTYEFPTFNLADSYLCIGAAILLIYFLFADIIFAKKNEEKELNNKPAVSEDIIKKNDELYKKENSKEENPSLKEESKDGKEDNK